MRKRSTDVSILGRLREGEVNRMNIFALVLCLGWNERGSRIHSSVDSNCSETTLSHLVSQIEVGHGSVPPITLRDFSFVLELYSI